MARNGSGTYNLPAGNPVTTGTTISSTWANGTLSDMASALTGSVASDGQTTPTANLPMGTFAHTNVGNATVRTMYPSAGQLQDGVITYLTSVSGTNTITAVAALGMNAYAIGQKFLFVSSGGNTGAATLNINSIGAKSITKNGTTALVSGDMPSGAAIEVFYDGTQFQLLNPASAAPIPANVSSFSAGTTGLTPSTSTTGAVTLAGTLAVANGGTGLATLTANNVMLGNGTSTPSFVAPGASGNALISNGTTFVSGKQTITSATAVASASQTSIDFTGIPSGVKRITVMFNQVSTNATSYFLVQIGSTTFTTSGYVTSAGNRANELTSVTNGFLALYSNVPSPSDLYSGQLVLTNISGNTWVSSFVMSSATYVTCWGTGVGTASGVLDRVRITTVNGTDTFANGTINIMYE